MGWHCRYQFRFLIDGIDLLMISSFSSRQILLKVFDRLHPIWFHSLVSLSSVPNHVLKVRYRLNTFFVTKWFCMALNVPPDRPTWAQCYIMKLSRQFPRRVHDSFTLYKLHNYLSLFSCIAFFDHADVYLVTYIRHATVAHFHCTCIEDLVKSMSPWECLSINFKLC